MCRWKGRSNALHACITTQHKFASRDDHGACTLLMMGVRQVGAPQYYANVGMTYDLDLPLSFAHLGIQHCMM